MQVVWMHHAKVFVFAGYSYNRYIKEMKEVFSRCDRMIKGIDPINVKYPKELLYSGTYNGSQITN